MHFADGPCLLRRGLNEQERVPGAGLRRGRCCAAIALDLKARVLWLKTGNIPATVAVQIEVRCLQVGSTSRVQEAENPGQKPRGAEDLFYQGGPVSMCHLESKPADERRRLAS